MGRGRVTEGWKVVNTAQKSLRVEALEALFEHTLWSVAGPAAGLFLGVAVAGKVAEDRRDDAARCARHTQPGNLSLRLTRPPRRMSPTYDGPRQTCECPTSLCLRVASRERPETHTQVRAALRRRRHGYQEPAGGAADHGPAAMGRPARHRAPRLGQSGASGVPQLGLRR